MLKSNVTNKPYAQILYESFLEMDKEYLNSASSSAGSTATVFLWEEEKGQGWIGSLGDTRAVLCRQGAILWTSLFIFPYSVY